MLQKIFDASATVVNKLERSTVRDAFKANQKLAFAQSTVKGLAMLPFIGTCESIKFAAKKTGRKLDTQKY